MSKSNFHKKLGNRGWNCDERTERAIEDDFYDEDMKQKPSTGKKKSNKKSHGKKIDHKHKYEQVVCVYNSDILGRPNRSAVLGKRCSVCGKLDGWDHPMIYDSKVGHYRPMTVDEILKHYSTLQVVEYK